MKDQTSKDQGTQPSSSEKNIAGLPQYGAILAIRTGQTPTEVASKITRVISVWSQTTAIYAKNLTHKPDLEAIKQMLNVPKENRITQEDSADLYERVFSRKALESELQIACDTAVNWAITGVDRKNCVTFQFSAEEFSRREQAAFALQKSLKLSGASLKVMSYGEGVCFIAPAHLDSNVYHQFRKIFED